MNTKPTKKRRSIEELIDEAGSIASEIARHKIRVSELEEAERKLRESASLDDDKAIAQLSAWRTIRDLMPRKIEALQRDLSVVEGDLVAAADGVWREIRNLARERLESERQHLRLELADVCGRDPIRLKAAVDAVLAQSESARWRNEFPLAALPTVPTQRARQALKCQKFFAAGKSLKAAFKP